MEPENPQQIDLPERYHLFFVLDESGSMDFKGKGESMTRFEGLLAALKSFLAYR
jgi:hypothetical protein